MLLGYARVSTDDQDLALQIKALEECGCDRIYQDKKSGKNLNRPGWIKCRGDLKPGDTLAVWKIDRLGRSIIDLIQTIVDFRRNEIDFLVITEAIDTRTAAGRFMFNILASLAEMEREMIAERTKAGIEQAKERGVVPGPVPRLTPEMWDLAVSALSERPDLTIPNIQRLIHKELQKPKDKPIAIGSISRKFKDMKAGKPYPERWKRRIDQYKQRLKSK